MKIRKFNIIKLTIVILLICPMVFFSGWFVIDRFCWRSFDYYFCGDPTADLSIAVRRFDENNATLIVYGRNWADQFDGYDYYVKDDTLFVGIKTVLFGANGFDIPTNIDIQTDEPFHKIVIKGRGAEKVFYPDDVI